jgi:hypothetical protein
MGKPKDFSAVSSHPVGPILNKKKFSIHWENTLTGLAISNYRVTASLNV